MKTVARVIAVFLGLLFIGSALFLVALQYDLIPNLALSLPWWADENVVLAISSALVLLALILLILGLRRSKKPGNAVVKGSEYGEVLISIAAIENMVLRVVQQTKGLKDTGRQVIFNQDGLTVRVKVRAMPDLALPGLINDLQARIKEYLEEMTGIVVHEVKVMVENIIMDQTAARK